MKSVDALSRTPEALNTTTGTLRRNTYVEHHAISWLAETLDYRPKAVKRAFADGERAWRELTSSSSYQKVCR